jgi:hypothetical protein
MDPGSAMLSFEGSNEEIFRFRPKNEAKAAARRGLFQIERPSSQSNQRFLAQKRTSDAGGGCAAVSGQTRIHRESSARVTLRKPLRILRIAQNPVRRRIPPPSRARPRFVRARPQPCRKSAAALAASAAGGSWAIASPRLQPRKAIGIQPAPGARRVIFPTRTLPGNALHRFASSVVTPVRARLH